MRLMYVMIRNKFHCFVLCADYIIFNVPEHFTAAVCTWQIDDISLRFEISCMSSWPTWNTLSQWNSWWRETLISCERAYIVRDIHEISCHRGISCPCHHEFHFDYKFRASNILWDLKQQWNIVDLTCLINTRAHAHHWNKSRGLYRENENILI